MKAKDTSSGSTLPRRQLGRELRKLREDAGLTVSDAAEAIGRSGPTLWRIEKGGSPMRPGDVAGMCHIYGAPKDLTEDLMALSKETASGGWWRNHTDSPRWLDTFIGLEQSADHIRAFSSEFIAGLLQTERYADATCRGARPAPSDAQRAGWVAVRLGRQRIITRRVPKPPQLDFVIGEAALLRPPKDRSAMWEQLRRLSEATELANVSIRILPLSEGVECAPDSLFHIIEFPPERNRRHQEPPIVYADSRAGGIYLDKHTQVSGYLETWHNILDHSLSQEDSLDLIRLTMERYPE